CDAAGKGERTPTITTRKQFGPSACSMGHCLSLLPALIVRRTFVRRKPPGRICRVFKALKQHATQRTQFVELTTLLVELFVQALYCIFQAHKFELYVNQTFFHCSLHVNLKGTR